MSELVQYIAIVFSEFYTLFLLVKNFLELITLCRFEENMLTILFLLLYFFLTFFELFQSEEQIFLFLFFLIIEEGVSRFRSTFYIFESLTILEHSFSFIILCFDPHQPSFCPEYMKHYVYANVSLFPFEADMLIYFHYHSFLLRLFPIFRNFRSPAIHFTKHLLSIQRSHRFYPILPYINCLLC